MHKHDEEVARLYAEGLKQKQIAECLKITQQRVSAILKRIGKHHTTFPKNTIPNTTGQYNSDGQPQPTPQEQLQGQQPGQAAAPQAGDDNEQWWLEPSQEELEEDADPNNE